MGQGGQTGLLGGPELGYMGQGGPKWAMLGGPKFDYRGARVVKIVCLGAQSGATWGARSGATQEGQKVDDLRKVYTV